MGKGLRTLAGPDFVARGRRPDGTKAGNTCTRPVPEIASFWVSFAKRETKGGGRYILNYGTRTEEGMFTNQGDERSVLSAEKEINFSYCHL
jgi:hypothetical protein